MYFIVYVHFVGVFKK